MTIQSITTTARKTAANHAGKTENQITMARIINVIIKKPTPTTRHSFFVSYMLFSSLSALLYPAIRFSPCPEINTILIIKKRPKIAHNIHSGERHAPIPHCPMNAEMASAVC